MLALGSFSTSFLGLIFTPLYTNVLSTAEYGIYDLIVTTSSLLYPFFTLAIGEAILRYALDKSSDKHTIFSSGMHVCLVGLLLLILAFPIVSRTVIKEYSMYFYAYFFMHCVGVITMNFVKGIEDVKHYSIAGIVKTVIMISLNLICLLLLKTGVRGYLFSVIAGQVVAFIYLFFASKLYRYLRPFWKMDFGLIKKTLIYSIPIIPNSISWWISNSSDKYILKYYTDLSQIGIYSVSYKIPSIIMTVMTVFLSAWQLSAVVDFGSEESSEFFTDIYKKCIDANFLIASMVIAFSPIMSKILFAKDFFSAWKYVPVLVLANVFNVLATFLGSVYTSAKKTKMLALTTVFAALTNIILNFVLIPKFGAMGAAIATMIAYFCMWIFRIINTRKIIRIDFDLKNDIICLFALGLQIILLESQTFVGWIITLLIFAIMLVIKRALFVSLISIVLNKFRKIN